MAGAHTLGKADSGASGYHGSWTDSSYKLENQYYKDVMDRDLAWRQVSEIRSVGALPDSIGLYMPLKDS